METPTNNRRPVINRPPRNPDQGLFAGVRFGLSGKTARAVAGVESILRLDEEPAFGCAAPAGRISMSICRRKRAMYLAVMTRITATCFLKTTTAHGHGREPQFFVGSASCPSCRRGPLVPHDLPPTILNSALPCARSAPYSRERCCCDWQKSAGRSAVSNNGGHPALSHPLTDQRLRPGGGCTLASGGSR